MAIGPFGADTSLVGAGVTAIAAGRGTGLGVESRELLVVDRATVGAVDAMAVEVGARGIDAAVVVGVTDAVGVVVGRPGTVATTGGDAATVVCWVTVTVAWPVSFPPTPQPAHASKTASAAAALRRR